MTTRDKAGTRKPKVTPDEMRHLDTLFQSWKALKALGWEEPRYFRWPEAHKEFELIELGSTGVHQAVHFGDPGKVCWVDREWPSYPFLVRRAKEANRG